MWNFGVPYPLKHYIDVVTLAGENWSWSRAEGYKSLLVGKKALLVYASAGDYGPNDPSDFQKPYLRRWLNFIGVINIQEITVAPTLADADALCRTRWKADAAAVQLAASFLESTKLLGVKSFIDNFVVSWSPDHGTSRINSFIREREPRVMGCWRSKR